MLNSPANLQLYRTRAAEARAEAEAATLDNVRDRCLRAAEAWERMADRIARAEKGRGETGSIAHIGLGPTD